MSIRRMQRLPDMGILHHNYDLTDPKLLPVDFGVSNYFGDGSDGDVTIPKIGWIDVAADGYTLFGDLTLNGGLAAAFDGNASQSWTGSASNQSNVGHVGVDFGSSKSIFACDAISTTDLGFVWSGSTDTCELILQGSDDNSTWINLSTTGVFTDVDSLTTKSFPFSEQYYTYRFFRLKIVGDSGVSETACVELKLYGASTTLHNTINYELFSVEDGDMIVKNYKNLTIDAEALLTVSNRCRGALLFVDGDFIFNSSVVNSSTYIGDMTLNGGLVASFNGTLHDIFSNSSGLNSVLTGNVGMDFGSTQVITGARVYSASNGFGFTGIVAQNVTFQLQYSDDNSAWVSTGFPVTVASAINIHVDLSCYASSHRYWRVVISVPSSDNIVISEVEWVNAGCIDMSARGCHANPAMSEKGGWIDVATDGYTLIGDITGCGGLAASFNGIASQPAAGGSCASGILGYVGVDFGASKKIYKVQSYGITDGGGFQGGSDDCNITLQGSSDNNTWTDLDSTGIFTSFAGDIVTFNANNYWEYRYYRVKIDVPNASSVNLSELKMFGESTTYHELETPVAPGDGNPVDVNGIQIPFFTYGDSDALVCHFEGCGIDAYALNDLFPSGSGRLVSIPRVGAAGIPRQTVKGNGLNGNAGVNGETGSGGQGSTSDSTYFGGASSAGTCFSGGSGGGGFGNGTQDASLYGGKGGDSYNHANHSSGIGNPNGIYGTPSVTEGTGGLLIIICSGNVIGSGFLKANGVDHSAVVTGSGGGASGGGCIVLATKKPVTSLTIQVNGGIGGLGDRIGGDGGSGSIITIGDLK